MNIYKFVILWLVAIPMVFAGTFGDMPLVDDADVSLDGGYDLFAEESFFHIIISNNNINGYTINAQSSNGSQFNSDNTTCVNAGRDGCILQYQLDCSGITLGDSTPRASTGAQTLFPKDTDVIMLNISNPAPTAATVNQDMACSFKIIADESEDELFSGEYSDTVTVTSTLL